jgi:ribonucleoside-diphosphate reductase alpha chain
MTVQEWLGNNQLGIDIWEKKYRQNKESFDEWLDRVSGGNEDIKALIKEKKFLFGGRILSNRGLHKDGVKVTYSNCYVITPPEDSIESIFDCASKLARTFSYGGGCGVDISNLAPRGAKVNNTAKETSGAVSFMDLYSTVTGLIGQNGRRGALMLSISCEHPDLEEFIEVKSDLNRITKANISIRLTDEFMRAVEEDREYTLRFTREATGETIEKKVNARSIFMRIAQMNWDYAEPGALFWDRITDYNLLSETNEFKYAGVNPCAEEPLPAGGSCLLGSLNLAEFVKDNNFDFDEFSESVRRAVVALNEVLDEGLPLHPLKEQRDSVRDWRQIGLGVMGIADMLIKMGIRYGSPESISICDAIGQRMVLSAIEASCELAKKYGHYPKCNPEKIEQTEFFKAHVHSDKMREDVLKYGLRNSQLLTIAPTGTLSTMLGVSGGIEPIFANFYERKTESLHGKDVYYKVYTPIVRDYMDANGISDDSQLPSFFVTAQTLNFHERIAMQAVWQKHIDASISSTVNVPNSFTVEGTFNLYMEAWKNGLKGVTIFRDGCKRTGILTTDKSNEHEHEVQPLPRGFIIPKSDDLVGKLRTLTTGCGSLHVTAFFDPFTGDFVHAFLSKGSTGGCANFMVGLSRMISLAARGGISLDDIVDQLNSCGSCSSYAVRSATKHDTSKGSCCPMAIGNALIDMHNEMLRDIGADESEDKPEPKPVAKPMQKLNKKNPCPSCGEELVFEGGCNSCKNCGYSRCS